MTDATTQVRPTQVARFARSRYDRVPMLSHTPLCWNIEQYGGPEWRDRPPSMTWSREPIALLQIAIYSGPALFSMTAEATKLLCNMLLRDSERIWDRAVKTIERIHADAPEGFWVEWEVPVADVLGGLWAGPPKLLPTHCGFLFQPCDRQKPCDRVISIAYGFGDSTDPSRYVDISAFRKRNPSPYFFPNVSPVGFRLSVEDFNDGRWATWRAGDYRQPMDYDGKPCEDVIDEIFQLTTAAWRAMEHAGLIEEELGLEGDKVTTAFVNAGIAQMVPGPKQRVPLMPDWVLAVFDGLVWGWLKVGKDGKIDASPQVIERRTKVRS